MATSRIPIVGERVYTCEDMIAITITSLFISCLLVLKWNIASRLKQVFNISPIKRLKPFDCLPCMSFWIAVSMSFLFAIFANESIYNCLLASMLSFVISIKIER